MSIKHYPNNKIKIHDGKETVEVTPHGEANTVDVFATDILREILLELKKINMHLSEMSDIEYGNDDIEL